MCLLNLDSHFLQFLVLPVFVVLKRVGLFKMRVELLFSSSDFNVAKLLDFVMTLLYIYSGCFEEHQRFVSGKLGVLRLANGFQRVV